MDVKKAIEIRRSYRSLDRVKIDENLLNELASAIQLCLSCFNNQPWRYVFAYEEDALNKVKEALNEGNKWATDASMIIAVTSKKDLDCVIKDGRDYYLFDTGMATAFMILRAAELGFVAHPIAGYAPQKVREALGIPQEMEVITLVIFGKHSDVMKPSLSQKQAETEKERPQRKPVEAIVFFNKYKI
ncbi:MAG: nitroreductase family protein [Elusimicrobia bacterium]|nr:nitroreductase family protein [Candidatus Liberimonas magnetica]